ncbi:hypothetical protein MICA_774 [Micavibrio aeruginosavorus ARL-13]|uniref:Uncharacterized protein n=1 Tax=Micavibrio aeruginosavorus (strain ARL-13) TaxID=856793 RepID=G2KQH2_MICAA|nr:hypothetical protein MICA_774 [Micavibrio aeruginosavorus ARL-13]
MNRAMTRGRGLGIRGFFSLLPPSPHKAGMTMKGHILVSECENPRRISSAGDFRD